MKYSTLSLGFCIALLMFFSSMSVSQAQQTTYYYIFSQMTPPNLVIDVAGSSTADGANVLAYNFTGNPNQKFAIEDAGGGYVSFRSKHSNKYLDVANGGTLNGTNIHQYQKNNTKAQKFKLIPKENGYFAIESAVMAGKVLDIFGGNPTPNSNFNLQGYTGNWAQHFRFVVAEPGDEKTSMHQLSKAKMPGKALHIVSQLNPNMVIDAKGGGLTNGTNLWLYGLNGTPAQQFIFSKKSNGYCTVKNKKSGLFMDVTGSATADGTNIQLWPSNGSANQLYGMYYRGNGYYTLDVALASSKVVDVYGGQPTVGANINLQKYTGHKAQLFQLILAAPTAVAPVTKPKVDPNAVTVKFVNTSSQTVDVFHVSEDEKKEWHYATLKPGTSYDQGTYKGHKWKAVSRATEVVFLTYTTPAASATVRIKEVAPAIVVDDDDHHGGHEEDHNHVEINWLNLPSSVTSEKVTVTAEIWHSDNILEYVFINDQRVDKSKIKREEVHGKFRVVVDATLSVGENTIEMTIVTKDGKEMHAPSATIKYKKALTSTAIKPNVYFLGIGVSAYENNNFPSLEYADDDVIAIRDKFVAMENSALYGKVKTKLVLNEKATLANINQELGQFFNKVSSTDYAILMFSSHGEAVNEEFYIIPYDCPTDPGHFSFRAISSIDLGKFMKNVQASKMLFLDACHSGAAGLDIVSKGVDATENKVNKVLKNVQNEGSRSYIFSSSTGNQKSQQISSVQHGVFTHAILMAMEGKSYLMKTDGEMADKGKEITPKALKGVLMMGALQDYVKDVVMDITFGNQKPAFKSIADQEGDQGADMPIYLIK